MLDGGLPRWLSDGYKLDEAPVSDEDLDAAMRAAQHPPSHTQYKAKLQVQHMHACQHALYAASLQVIHTP